MILQVAIKVITDTRTDYAIQYNVHHLKCMRSHWQSLSTSISYITQNLMTYMSQYMKMNNISSSIA